VRAADLAAQVLLRGGAVMVQIGRVVLAHVVFEGLRVGLWRRLPFRLLGAGVEVVGEVLAVGVADFLGLV
jgi:hypothetical protein